MGRLKKLGDKKWKIIIELGEDEQGIRRRKTKTVNMPYPEAKELMRELEDEILNKQHLNDNILLKNHLKEFIDTHAKTIKPLTEKSYRQQIDAYLIPNLGDYKLQELNAKIIDDFYTEMLENGMLRGAGGLSKRSVRYLHVILKKALDKAIDWDRLSENPADKATPPKKQRTKNKDVNPKELVEIINSVKEIHYKYIFEFALRTGLRRGEILGLKWSAVDWDRQMLSVMRNLQRLPDIGFIMQEYTKNNTAYTTPIGKKVIKILEEVEKIQKNHKVMFKREYKDDNLVFCNENGSPIDPDVLSSAFSRYAENNGSKYTFHDLRHGFGAIQIMSGTHTKTLQELLNHKSETTTADIYSHIAEKQKTDAAEKIDEFF